MRENKARMDEAIADEMGNARRLLANLSPSAHPPTGGGGIIEARGLERAGGRGSGDKLENGAFYSCA